MVSLACFFSTLRHPVLIAVKVEEGPPIVKADRNSRSYKLIKLCNGLSALLIHDPQVCDDDKEDDRGGGDMMISRNLYFGQIFSTIAQVVMTSSPTGSHACGFIQCKRPPDEEGGSNGASLLSRRKQDKEPEQEISIHVCWSREHGGPPRGTRFLEHMLFMGSTKFPDENECDKFLSQHGGSSNAYTDQEFTCYHFEVRNRSLRDALEWLTHNILTIVDLE